MRNDIKMITTITAKEFPVYDDFLPLNVDEVTALSLWAETNYPKCRFSVSRDMCIARITNYPFILEGDEPLEGYVGVFDIQIAKFRLQSLDETAFVTSILEHFTFTDAGTISSFLNELHYYLVKLANSILPANTGLNPKTKVFQDELVNDVRE